MTTARAALIERAGGPEVIGWRDVELPPPGPGQVLMRHAAVGLNYIDTYHRDGTYPVPMPAGLGLEVAGVVEAVGEGVADLRPGDRVATFGPERGAYSTARNVAGASLFRLPDDVAEEDAAALLLKGCTVEFLAERCAKVAPGMTVLVHAAAGGVGLILCAWLRALGVRVIGTVGSAEKAAHARDAGCDEVILYAEEPVAPRVRELTGGAGVSVVFDGVGQATWDASLASLARRGLLVSYGNASAPVTGVALGRLAQAGSVFVTRPTLFDYYADPAERAAGVARLWAMLRSGAVRPTIGRRYPLEEAAQAHRDLQARRTTGSILLIP